MTSQITGAWTAWTPTVTAGSGAITGYTATAKYQQVNSQLGAFEFSVKINTVGTASSDMHITLPLNFTGNAFADCVARETAVTGALAFCYYGGGGTTLDIYSTFLTSSSTIWGTNYNWSGLMFIPGTWS